VGIKKITRKLLGIILKDSILPFVASLLLCLIVFWPTLSTQEHPIASDILNSEHGPWKDIPTDKYPFPLPVKNFESFDAIRQNIPWKYLIATQYKKGEFPLWNPTQLSGTPLAGEFLAGPFYPLNALLIILPFVWGWTFNSAGLFSLCTNVLFFALVFSFKD
jgi:hypothetical protein